jgi:hypothetical protein
VTLVRALFVILLISWAVGFAFLPEYSPWIHAPLVLALVTLATLLTGRRPRVKRHA